MRIDKQLYNSIVDDFNRKLQAAEQILIGDYISEDERKIKLYELISTIEMINNNIYKINEYENPIDLSQKADTDNFYQLTSMKEELEVLFSFSNNNKIRDAYFQYWLLVNDDKYLEPVIDYTNIKIGFLLNCLYLDEENDYITIENVKYDKSYFFFGQANSDIISRLSFLVSVFSAIYEKFSVIIKKYMINPKYINVDREKLKSIPAFYGDDYKMNEEFVMSILLDLIDNFFYIRAILLKKEKIFERDIENASLLIDIRELLEQCNFKYKNLVNNFYKTSDYLIYEVDSSELLRVTLSKLYYMIDFVTELRHEKELTKEKIISILELKRDVLYTSTFSENENYPLQRIEMLIDKFINEIIMLISDKIGDDFTRFSNRIKIELGDKYKYLEGSAFKSLVTAEYLYELLVKDKEEENPKMDYSCISILYYKALEDSLNNLIYKPYYDKYMNNVISKLNQVSSNVLDYLPVSKYDKEPIQTIKRSYYNYNKPQYELARVLTLGSFGYFLHYGNAPKLLRSFFTSIFKDTFNSCKSLSLDIMQIKDNRNDAAHGGNIISIEKVKEDKENIYILAEAVEYKRILLMLLNCHK